LDEEAVASHPLPDLFGAQELISELREDQDSFGKRGEGWTLAEFAGIALLLIPPFTLTVRAGGVLGVGVGGLTEQLRSRLMSGASEDSALCLLASLLPRLCLTHRAWWTSLPRCSSPPASCSCEFFSHLPAA
jgi:hypothetical protein